MKKILLQLDTDPTPSVFDAVTAYDAGAEIVMQYGSVTPETVRDLVHGVMFTRGAEGRKNSAVFIGGNDVGLGESVLEAVRETFFGSSRNSVMVDSSGCNTTAAAAVTKIAEAVDLKGKKVVVLAGTGPVGLRASLFLTREGALVTMTSRTRDKAEKACGRLGEEYGVKVYPAEAKNEAATRTVLEGATAVMTAGSPGVMLLPRKIWKEHPSLKVLGDINASPPFGIEGIQARWDGFETGGKTVFGPLAIGGRKMRIHRNCVARLFESCDLVLDEGRIYSIARSLTGGTIT